MSEPRPYYPGRFLFGPLLIITIGVVFLLRNMGYISYATVGWWFARFWPLLLIIWGLLKYGEYLWARKHQVPYRGIGGGGVVFLIFMILLGMTATGASHINWPGLANELDVDNDFSWGIFGTQFEFTENFAQPLQTGAQIKVISSRGSVKVTPSADNQAHAFLHKYIVTHSQDEANRLNDSTHAKFQQQGSLWVLDITGSGFAHGRFDLELQLPRASSLSVETRRGGIHVGQLDGNVELDTMRGEIVAEDIKGNASLRLRNGNVSAKNINGNVTVDGNVRDADIQDIGGTLVITGTYFGDTHLAHIARQIHVTTSRTDLQMAKLEGELNLDPHNLRGNSLGGPLRVDTGSKYINMDDVSGDVHVEDSHGDVTLQAKLPLGNMDISTTGGQITLSLPEKAGFQVDAETGVGNIQSDFNVNLSNSGSGATATGTVGKGGPQIKLKTNRGTIQIRKQ